MKEKALIVLGSVLGGGLLTWMTVKLIRRFVSNNEEKESFEEGTSATIAKQIKMAFENDGWFGTNTRDLREILIAIPSKEEWEKIIKSYERLYSEPTKKANLLKDLSDELQSTEYNEMMQIIGAKPAKKGGPPSTNQYRAWAKRFKAAFAKSYSFLPGTDSESVTATLREIPSIQAFVNTGVEYKRLYKANLMKVLESEAEFGQWAEWKKIIVQKPKS